MKKFVIIFLILFILLVSSGIFYLNQFYLPKTIKSLIVKGIEEQTNTKVALESVKVNIFKGLVLKNISLSYEQGTILRVKEASCIFIPWAVFRKEIIIPNIHLNSAELFIKRKKDGTFNIQDIFFIEPPKKQEPLSYVSAAGAPTYIGKAPPSEKGFNVSVYRVSVSASKIIFEDDTLPQPFIKSIEDFGMVMHLSLPASLKFKFSGRILAKPILAFNAWGEFKVPEQDLNVKAAIVNISPKEFAPYYQNSGLNIKEGLIKALISLRLKDNRINCDYELNAKELLLVKDKLTIKSNLEAKAILNYGFADHLLKHAGNAVIVDTDVSGVEMVDRISGLNARISFDESGLYCDKITADILSLPVAAKFKLTNFMDPSIILNAATHLNDLTAFQKMLHEKYKINLAGLFSGEGDLSLSVGGRLSDADNLNVLGYFDFLNAKFKLDKLDEPIEAIKGRIVFAKDKAQWNDFNLKFKGLMYKTQGSLVNFKTPLLDFKLDSSELNLATSLGFNDKLINISNCQGRYLTSDFAISGDIDTANPKGPDLVLSGALMLNLEDLHKLLPKSKDLLDKMKPLGKAHLQVNFSGNASDFNNSKISAKVSSDEFSLYGFRGKELAFDYNQADGIIDLPFLKMSLYGGSLNAAFKANINSQNLPYTLNFGIQNVLIEEVKKDTEAKDKDISGVIQGEFKSSGYLNNWLNSEGAGTIAITKGKLWELDLFKGMGKLLLVQDFTNIVFSEGNCSFVLKDKFLSTDNLILNSNMVNLGGPVRIGFDNSINAALDVIMVSGYVPSSGTFKDVTTVLLQDNKFGVIKISGTLKDPKYKFDPAVTDIIKSLSDIFTKKKASD
jgi:uncharacterized protein involved in outer membrane biogenesis